MRASIIIRAFNAEATITDAIESVLVQEFPAPDLEIIVIDDGSTDATGKLLEGYASHTNVRVIAQSNRGAVPAANAGFKAATGTYVGLLDHDDTYEPQFLAETTALFDADPKLDYVYTDYLESYRGEKRTVELKDLFQTIVDNALYRRSSLEAARWWREDVFFAEYDLLLRTHESWAHGHISRPLVNYNRREGSLTADATRVEKALAQLSDLHPDKLDLIKRIRSYALR